MDLGALGFDEWFEERANGLLQPGHSLARVTAVDRGAFRIRSRYGDTSAELSGKFRFSIQSTFDLPCVGDWVCVQCHASGGPAIIDAVVPRKTFLRRKCAGKTVDVQMIAANIDVAFIVQACPYDLNVRRLDRYLVMTGDGHVEPRIILSKTDLISPEELERTITQIKRTGISAQVLALSNTTGVGLVDFQALLLPGKTYCFLGSSESVRPPSSTG